MRLATAGPSAVAVAIASVTWAPQLLHTYSYRPPPPHPTPSSLPRPKEVLVALVRRAKPLLPEGSTIKVVSYDDTATFYSFYIQRSPQGIYSIVLSDELINLFFTNAEPLDCFSDDSRLFLIQVLCFNHNIICTYIITYIIYTYRTLL